MNHNIDTQLNGLVSNLDKLEANWAKASNKVSMDVWRRVSVLTKGLDTDSAGNIKKTVANLNKLGRIRSLTKNALYNDDYKRALKELDKGMGSITETHTEYFETLTTGEVGKAAFVRASEVQAKEALLAQMGENGVLNEVATEVANLIENDVRAGNSYAELQDKVKTIIRGNDKIPSRLIANSGQIVTDGMNQYAAQLNETFSQHLGLDWYMYVGGIIGTTRPFCKSLTRKRYVHRSEFGTVASGNINGQSVSRAGMINPTNATNLAVNRGGYNCRHQLYAVSDERVPLRLRNKFATGKLVEPIAIAKPKVVDKTKFKPKNYDEVMGKGADMPDEFWGLLEDDIDLRVAKPKEGSFHLNGNVVIDTKRYKSVEGRRSIIAHEGGHAIHNQTGWLKRDGSGGHTSSPILDLTFKNSKKRMGSGLKGEARNAVDLDLNSKTGWDGWDQVNTKFPDMSSSDMREHWGSTMDTIGSLTNNKYGGGHTKVYLKSGRGYGSKAEFFAHASENKWVGNPVFKELFPDLYNDMITMMNDLIKSKQ